MDTLQVVLRAIASLIVVIGLIMWLSRKFAGPGNAPVRAPGATRGFKGLISGLTSTRNPASGKLVQVAGRQMLSNKVQLVVVDVDGERLVLSVAESGAQVLSSKPAPMPATQPATQAVPAPTADTTTMHSTPEVRDFDQELSRQVAKSTTPSAKQSWTEGSVLSPNTWLHAKAAMKAARVGRSRNHTQLTPSGR